ncbi:VOC family protein [Aeromicrobium sp. 9AM]|uniref:VOC family protein n=1 Tax=Aeromicrobium sp. 9AM TaxID=2653126 RepID=UPI0012F33FDA|nr:VOC family protein [Aeromicrobium sp. 9AM]VXB31979.1 Bleomycin resistance protein [Aeromicrobium sp. 9AM]
MGFSRTVPALPVRDMPAAIAFYETRFGFDVIHSDGDFARLNRDDAQVHLWLADDTGWRSRPDFADAPVRSGAEDFIAGTASCRIDVDSADEVFTEMQAAGVLHYTHDDAPKDTTWGTREVDTLDLDGNLLTFVERLS